MKKSGWKLSLEIRKRMGVSQIGNKNHKNPYPSIPDLCHCGCGEFVYCGNKYIHGHHPRGIPKSDSQKKKMSENNWMKNPKNSLRFRGRGNNMYGRSPSKLSGTGHGCYYNSPLQGKIWLRSSYELAYAKYLDSIHELWMYEMETFELQEELSYKPDFFLPRLEKFVEIKGFLFLEDKIKIERFREEYPWDLEVLFREDLISLGANIK